jgi:hypothetical protein
MTTSEFAAITVLISTVLALPATTQVSVKPSPEGIDVQIDGKPFTTLFIGPDAPKPYLHPLRAATGTIVTRRYPMEDVEGEIKDHEHHRGLWFAHGNVNGYDFWANEPGFYPPDRLVRIVFTKLVGAHNGQKTGSIDAFFEWQDPRRSPLLLETRNMVFYSDPKLRIIDFDITLTAIQRARFGDTKEGTFAIRRAAELEESWEGEPKSPARTGRLVNADGLVGEARIWGKRSNWVDGSGSIAGEKVGMAIFDHPDNPRHPTYWHVRARGLLAANVFGWHDFYHDKWIDAGMTLDPGQFLRFRYRVVIHPGDALTAGVAQLYEEYARSK